MKFDQKLALKILKEVEAFPPVNDGEVRMDGYSPDEISYHIKKLSEDGLLLGKDASGFGSTKWLATELTASGHRAIEEATRMATELKETEKADFEIDPHNVFVVHGRNVAARNELFTFLRSIGLRPLEWDSLIKQTGKGSPYNGEVLENAFKIANAVVVLMTPDDEARLIQDFVSEADEPYESILTPQARPNVLFEAGMAFGLHPDKTIIVEMGRLRPYSDVAGRNVIRLDNSTQKRQALAKRLQTAGCPVDLDGLDWHSSGDFEKVLEDIKKNDSSKEGYSLSSIHSFANIQPNLFPELKSRCSRSNGYRVDECNLIVAIHNRGTRTISNYRIEILFPAQFLGTNVFYRTEVTQRRTETHRLFRVLPDFNQNKPLFPGDNLPTSIGFHLTDEQKANPDAFGKVLLSIYEDDVMVLKKEYTMSEILKLK